MKSNSSSAFREDEVVMMSHWDKQAGANVTTPPPRTPAMARGSLVPTHRRQAA